MKLRALIADDEAPARAKIRHFLDSHPEIEVIAECGNGADALEAIRNKQPDLLFLDVQMPLINGFALLKRSGSERHFAVIFVTAYDEYAVKAFEENAADYLLKPFTRRRFDEALRKAVRRIRQESDHAAHAMALLQRIRSGKEYLHRIAVKSNQGVFFLPCEQIDWIESEDNYILVHAGKQAHLLRESMSAIEKALDPARFLRIHRRILVNADRIREILPQPRASIVLQDGSTLPVSRRLKVKVKRFLLNHPR